MGLFLSFDYIYIFGGINIDCSYGLGYQFEFNNVLLLEVSYNYVY